MATETAERRSARAGGRPVIWPWLSTLARLGLAVVLFMAGWAKFSEPPALQKLAVSAYQILPDGMAGPVGIGLPILEMSLAGMLLLGFATRFIAAGAGLLMIIFIAGIISAWTRGLSIDCGCFGGGGAVGEGQTHYVQEILRDLGFLALAAWITVLPKSRLALDRILGLYGD
jgi:uncharacterized membrane protein YphA (DoxX/SURF4 family)